MDKQEKACDDVKALYQAVCQIRIHWSDVIVRNIHYAIILISAIWGFLGKAYIDTRDKVCCGHSEQSWHIFIAALLSSVVVILWRWYSHHLDKAITGLYPELVYYEGILGAEDDEGTWGHLKKNLFKSKKTDRLTPLQRKIVIAQLVEDRLVGCRCHNAFDFIAGLTIMLGWIITLFLSWNGYCRCLKSCIVIGFVVSAFFLSLVFALYCQGKPSKTYITNAISKATGRDGGKPSVEPEAQKDRTPSKTGDKETLGKTQKDNRT
jgi:hypothetical protein